jgi:hypothetical protein
VGEPANSQAQRIERQARKAGARIAELERSITDKLERPDATDTLRWRLRATGQAWRRAMASLEHRVFQALRRTMIWFRVRDRLRRGRRRRVVLAYLKGAQNQTRAELASSAMLAVLTERIARAGATEISADEIAETVAQAEGIVVGYQGQIAQIEPLLAKARTRTERWMHWSSVAEARGSAELAAKARAYREACEGDERELVKAIEDCQAGCRRLRDAIEQVQALAQRSTTAAPTTGSE